MVKKKILHYCEAVGFKLLSNYLKTHSSSNTIIVIRNTPWLQHQRWPQDGSVILSDIHIVKKDPDKCVCVCLLADTSDSNCFLQPVVHPVIFSISDVPVCWCWTCRSAAQCGHWSCYTGFSWQSWDGSGCHSPPVAPAIKKSQGQSDEWKKEIKHQTD